MSRSAKRFFAALMVGTMALMALVLFGLGPALLLAATLAVLLWPVQQWLSARLRNHRSIAGGLLVFAVLTLLIAPFAAISAFVVREAAEGVRFVTTTVDREGIEGLVDRLPALLQPLATRLAEQLPDQGQLQETVNAQGGKAAAAVGGVVAATGSFLFQAVMMLIALYFFLVEGKACVEWLDEASPLRKGQTRELLLEVKKVGRSVILSTFITAGVQSLAAVVGFLIARVPHPLFFAAVTFFCAMIPAVGAAAVVCAAAVLLFLGGHPFFALFLAIWGLVVVGLIDNLVKPLLIKGDVELNGAIIFFSLVGGIAAFGTIGLLIGPFTIALFLALLRMYHRDVSPKGRNLDRVAGIAGPRRRERPGAPAVRAD